MERIERINATALVVNSVKAAIQRGELKIGDKLPREYDMAQELGVGRSSLREGIKILNAYGVVESRQGEGTFIVDNTADKFFEFMGFLPSKENVANFLELRRVIEVGNIVAIYDKLTDKDFENIEKLVNDLDGKRFLEDYVKADKDFHNYLLSFSNNPMIMQVNNMITAMRGDLLNRLFQHEEILEDARIAHRQILEALRKRDLEACVAAVSSHIDITVVHAGNVY